MTAATKIANRQKRSNLTPNRVGSMYRAIIQFEADMADTKLTLELSADLYERLRRRADRLGKTPQQVAEGLLARELVGASARATQERDRVTEVLRAAGLLTSLAPEERQKAESTTATLNEVQTALDRAGGRPLSEVIIEMRGPKD